MVVGSSAPAPAPALARPADILELVKARIVGLVLVTVAAGFTAASLGGIDLLLLVHTLFGTALVAAGTNALNQVVERDADARMRRTAERPLPAGRMAVGPATLGAWMAGALGVGYLAMLVNATTAALAALTLLSYVCVYTPLKQKTTLATLVGAVPGALPIVGGYAAAGGRLGVEALVLFAILFLWQLPHFLALAWIYRDEYANAGFRMLSADDPDGRLTFQHAMLYAAALVPASLAPTLVGMTGSVYFWGALVLSSVLLWAAITAVRRPSRLAARRLFRVTIFYLPGLLALLMLNPGL
ncbi:MAG: protoheme IX farnesyltransferase [Gemmatimonadales bacterium]|nr:protoheme IX farnesyltransferase [Gemmatimonadales bacterium]